MSDPRNRGAATAPPTRGEGCLQRFDPHAVSEAHGADFSAAASLWQAVQLQNDKPPETPKADPEHPSTLA